MISRHNSPSLNYVVREMTTTPRRHCCSEFDYDYLHLWGHYRLMTELHERLQGKITNPELAGDSADNVGIAYSRDRAGSDGRSDLSGTGSQTGT